MSQSDPHQGRYRLALVALFLSGAAGLVHEVAWAKLLARLIGSTAHAQALVLALFMGGLAWGAVRYGSRAKADAGGLRLYARLELLIGAYGVVLPLLSLAAAGLHELAAPLVFGRPALAFALRFVLAAGIALLPAVWMGGTLPVLAACLTRSTAETRSRVGALYAVNNVGAVLGSLVAGFILLAWLGVFGSLFVAALLNFASAFLGRRLAAAWPEGESAPADETAREAPKPEAVSPQQARAALVVLALSGYAAMGYEAVFSRVISLAFGGSTYSFTVMLAAFITGIGVGSAVIARVRVRRTLELLGTLQLAAGAAFLAVTPALARLPYWTGLLRADLQEVSFGFGLYQAGKAALCLLVLLVPTACLGAGFPLVAALQVRAVAAVGSTVGRTYAWNTAGNVLGVLLTGLVVLPAAGLGAAFASCVAVSLAAGLLALVAAPGPFARRAAPAGLALIVLLVQLATLGGDWLVPLQKSVDHLRLRTRGYPAAGPTWGAPPASSFEAWKAAFVKDVDRAPRAWFGEDANATVLAIGNDEAALLAVNTKPDASVSLDGSDMSTQQFLAHVPALLSERRETALVIGYGSGVTAGSLLQHPFEHVDVVEISPAVLGAHPVFAPFNHDALADPRVEVFAEDGRNFLRTVPRRYDVITSEPSNPWLAGIGALFTEEFFRDVRERLAPGGVACIWVHTSEQSEEAVELVLRTLSAVFPSVSAVRATPTGTDLVLLARAEPGAPDFAELERRFDEPAVHADLERIGAFNLASILVSESVSPARLPRLLSEGPLNREQHERLEYLAPEAVFDGRQAPFVAENDALLVRHQESVDSWIDGYLAWRRSQGEPVGREEMSVAVGFSGAELVPGHPLLVALRQLQAECPPAAVGPDARPSRRALPPPASVGFELAFQLAARFHKLGDAARARPYYARAVELRPGDVNACWNYAKVLEALGELEEEARVLSAGLEANPSSTELVHSLAAVEARLGRVGVARDLLTRLANTRPDPVGLTLLAELERISGRVDEALPWYRRAIELSAGEYWPASDKLVRLLDRLGRRSEADRVLTEALAVNPQVPELLALAEQRRGAAGPGRP